eukprot:tig00000270_g23917.t1
MHYLDFMKYPIEALAINEMYDLPYADNPMAGVNMTAMALSGMPMTPVMQAMAALPSWSGQLTLKQFQLETDEAWVWRDLGIGIAYYFVLEFVAFLCLKYKRFKDMRVSALEDPTLHPFHLSYHEGDVQVTDDREPENLDPNRHAL